MSDNDQTRIKSCTFPLTWSRCLLRFAHDYIYGAVRNDHALCTMHYALSYLIPHYFLSEDAGFLRSGHEPAAPHHVTLLIG